MPEATKIRFPEAIPVFRIVTSSSEAAKAVRAISAAVRHGITCSPEAGDAYELLSSLYGLTASEAQVISLIADQGIGRYYPGDFSPYITRSIGECYTLWNGLHRRGFLKQDYHENTHSLTPLFIHAVLHDIPLTVAEAICQYNSFIRIATAVIEDELTKKGDGEDDITTEDPAKEDDDDRLLFGAHNKVNSPVAAYERLQLILEEYPHTAFAEKVLDQVKELPWRARLMYYLLLAFFSRHFTLPVSVQSFKSQGIRSIFWSGIGALVRHSLAVQVFQWNREEDKTETKFYRISPGSAELFKGKSGIVNLSAITEFGRVLRPGEIEDKELFFAKGDERNMSRLSVVAREEEYGRIIRAFREKGLRSNIAVLMYGAPGTGKTELARQVARLSGRTLVVADAAKLNGIYIGESSINYRNFFQVYRYICAVESLAPILFLDEADGILGTRQTDVSNGKDKDANCAQNILLDEMNTLPGILIATTNLKDNLDPAAFRRFNLHLQFHLPDEAARTRIWRSKLPELTEDDAVALARRFTISGGVMDNVASMVVMDEILEDRRMGLDDIISYCENQVQTTASQRNRIGF